jgi:hypothetical protein
VPKYALFTFLSMGKQGPGHAVNLLLASRAG